MVVAKPTVDEHRVPIDPIAVLALVEDQPKSWLSPGPVQLELGGAGIESPGGSRPIEVALVDRSSNFVRAVVRLEHARFSLWSDRARLFGVLDKDHRITAQNGRPSETFVLLRAGARVKRLARKNKQTQIRYVGALEVETWIPDELLVDQAPGGSRMGKFASGRRPATVFPGSIVRSEPQWGSNQLAVVTSSFALDTVQELPDGWIEVMYNDGDVSVHGFTSKRLPPGQVHRPRDPDAPPPVTTRNAKVSSGTCLYAKREGDEIGYVVGDRDVQLDDAGSGWWTLSLDTSWGPIPFAAKGPSAQALTPCAPAGSVPASVP